MSLTRRLPLCLPLSLLLLALAGCTGVGATCHRDSECGAGNYCAGPDDPQTCGIPPRQECASSADCAPSTFCHAIPEVCSPTGVGTTCNPSCLAGGACGPGFRCNAEGACEPLPCDEGFRCPPFRRCDPAVAHGPGPAYLRANGCVDVPCAADGDCPAGGACVDGVCHSGPGTCRADVPVP